MSRTGPCRYGRRVEPVPTVLVVVGTGTAAVEPTTAAMFIGLEATAETPGSALATVTQASEAVLAAAHAHGVTDTDIRTQVVSVNQKTNMHG